MSPAPLPPFPFLSDQCQDWKHTRQSRFGKAGRRDDTVDERKMLTGYKLALLEANVELPVRAETRNLVMRCEQQQNSCHGKSSNSGTARKHKLFWTLKCGISVSLDIWRSSQKEQAWSGLSFSVRQSVPAAEPCASRSKPGICLSRKGNACQWNWKV